MKQEVSDIAVKTCSSHVMLKRKRVLVLLPCLEPAGGIGVLKNLLEIQKDFCWDIAVVSKLEGKMREVLEEMGISVSIELELESETFLQTVQACYDEVFVNTLQMISVVRWFNGKNILVHWWIHEPPAYFKLYDQMIPKQFWSNVQRNIRVYSAGQFVHDYILDTYGYDSEVLNFGVKDVQGDRKVILRITREDKISFLLPAFYFDPIKGRDILLKALMLLPQQYLERAEFFFLGHVEEDMKPLYEIIKKLEWKWGNIHYLPPVNHDEMLEIMSEMDCLVAPSREDATNACIVEGMMLEKLCICSDGTGVSRYLQDCESAFVFPTENVEELVKRILLVIDMYGELEHVAIAGRQVYEQVFSEKIFYKRVSELFENNSDEIR